MGTSLAEVAESLTAHPLFGKEDVWRHEVATPDVARVEFASLASASPTFEKLVSQWDSAAAADNDDDETETDEYYLGTVRADKKSARSELGGGNATLLRQPPRVRLADVRRISEELFLSKLKLLLEHAKPHSKWGVDPFLLKPRGGKSTGSLRWPMTNLSVTAAALCSTMLQLPESGHNLLHVLAAQHWSKAADFVAHLANHSCGDSGVERCARVSPREASPVHACLWEALRQQDFCCNRTPQDLASTSGIPQLFQALVAVLRGPGAARPAAFANTQANHSRTHDGELAAAAANQGLHDVVDPRPVEGAPVLGTPENSSAVHDGSDDREDMDKCDFVEIFTGLPGPEDLAKLMLRNEPLIFRRALRDDADANKATMGNGGGAANAGIRNIDLNDWGIDAFARRHPDLLVEVCLNAIIISVVLVVLARFLSTTSERPISLPHMCVPSVGVVVVVGGGVISRVGNPASHLLPITSSSLR